MSDGEVERYEWMVNVQTGCRIGGHTKYTRDGAPIDDDCAPIDDVISRVRVSSQVFDLEEKKIGWGAVNKQNCGSI